MQNISAIIQRDEPPPASSTIFRGEDIILQ